MVSERQQREMRRIREVIANWMQTVDAKDAAGIARFYTSDGKFVVPGRPLAEGGEAVERAWHGLFATPGVRLSFAPTMIDVAEAGDMAYEIGRYRFGFDGPKGRIADHGKYVVVWKKVDGEWKAAADISTSTCPCRRG